MNLHVSLTLGYVLNMSFPELGKNCVMLIGCSSNRTSVQKVKPVTTLWQDATSPFGKL
jgi:hypothetical protein